MAQSEAQLEQSLIEPITGMSYQPITVRNVEDLKATLENQLEKLFM